MRTIPGTLWRTALMALLLSTPAHLFGAVDDSRYARITIRGSLADPETGKPMVGAVLRFVSTAEDGAKFVGITDQEGKFFMPGLAFGDYVVDITTADGEVIRGINTVPLAADAPVEVVLKISRRVKSTTSVENRPERFVAVVQKGPEINWPRFWKEFAMFFGMAAGAGAGL